MQILKSANIFLFKWKWYVEDFTLKHLRFKICVCKICKKVIDKHSETIKYVENSLSSKEIYNLHGQKTLEFLRLRKQKFKGFVFLWTKAYREIFKSALVYLNPFVPIATWLSQVFKHLYFTLLTSIFDSFLSTFKLRAIFCWTIFSNIIIRLLNICQVTVITSSYSKINGTLSNIVFTEKS